MDVERNARRRRKNGSGDAAMTTTTSRRQATDVSITVALSTLMVAVALVLAIFLIYFNYLRNRDAALLAAEDMMAALSEQVEERLLTTIEPVVSIADLAPELAPIGGTAKEIDPGFRRFLVRIVARFPQVDSVYVGWRDGSFFRVASLRSYNEARRGTLRVPENAGILLFTVAAVSEQAPRETIEYLASDGASVAPSLSRASTFDPRARPWYTRALETDRVTATPPYRFTSSGEIGLTAARRLQGELGGVFGVDLTLSNLSGFLALQRPTPESHLYLFTPEEKILAWAGGASDELRDGAGGVESASVPNLTDINDPFASILHKHSFERGAPPYEFDQQGRSYIAKRTEFTGPLGTTNYLGIVVPTDHFTGRIMELGRKSTFISIALILAAVPLIAFASRAFSRPLQRLAVEADAIRAFELEGSVAVQSRVREIQALSTSMDRMKSGLRTFGVYVPRDLVRQMISQSSAPVLGGDRREITVLFSDIAGFTPIADGLEPEVVMQRMSTYFETATTALRGSGGTIDKFMGDAVMAMWNALVDDPQHPRSACCGVLAARAALAGLSARLVAQGLAPMPTRFGLHTGVAVVGNVGSSERMNFTALGATVNLAARLEPLNKVFGTEILISEQLAERVRQHFHLRSVAVVKPKGVTAPLRIYELLGERGSDDSFDWTSPWEAAFESFLGGDLDEARRRLEDLPQAVSDDPVRNRLLDRIAVSREAQGGEPWNPVEAL